MLTLQDCFSPSSLWYLTASPNFETTSRDCVTHIDKHIHTHSLTHIDKHTHTHTNTHSFLSRTYSRFINKANHHKVTHRQTHTHIHTHAHTHTHSLTNTHTHWRTHTHRDMSKKAWIYSAEEFLELYGKVETVVRNNCLLKWSGHLFEVRKGRTGGQELSAEVIRATVWGT